MEFLINSPTLLYPILALAFYGFLDLAKRGWRRIPALPAPKLKDHPAQLALVQGLCGDLYIQCHRLIDGDYAEASFLYHVWQSNGGTEDSLKDYEFKKAIEAAQSTFQAIQTSYHNLSIANIKLQQAGLRKRVYRWELLFVWLRGAKPDLLRLSRDEVDMIFNFTDLPASFQETMSEIQSAENPYLDIDFLELRPKDIQPLDPGLLGQISAIKESVDAQIQSKF